jgi:hypothetical protein
MHPRSGTAWAVNSKTLVRAGFRIFWAPRVALGPPIAAVGYNQTTTYTASTDNNNTPAGSLPNPFPTGASSSRLAIHRDAEGKLALNVRRELFYVERCRVRIHQRKRRPGVAAPVIVCRQHQYIDALYPQLPGLGSALAQSVANLFTVARFEMTVAST